MGGVHQSSYTDTKGCSASLTYYYFYLLVVIPAAISLLPFQHKFVQIIYIQASSYLTDR